MQEWYGLSVNELDFVLAFIIILRIGGGKVYELLAFVLRRR
jgi:hypothetical protein